MAKRTKSTVEKRCSTPAKQPALSLPVLDNGKSAKTVVRKSRSGRRRAIVLATVQLLIIAHIVVWLLSRKYGWFDGVTISPIEPSESMEFSKQGIINAGLIFFSLALLSTLILGRWFCGWGCHVVMLQDFCGWLMKKCGIHPKPFRSRLLLYIPLLLALYMFIWPVAYRWGANLFEFNAAHLEPWRTELHITKDDFWATFPGVMIAVPFLLICGFACVYFLGAKGYCTYGCPYGGFFAPIDKLAPGRIRVTDACEQCGHCTAVCTSNVRVHEEVHQYGMVVNPGCMKCLDCVSVCPNDALYFGFGRPALRKGTPRDTPRKIRFDLSWIEEIVLLLVFILVFVSFWGGMLHLPMLMRSGIAGVVTYLLWKAWRLVRDPNVNLHRFRLRYKGSIRPAGWAWLSLIVIVVLFTAHSGVANGMYLLGMRAKIKAFNAVRETERPEEAMEIVEAQTASAHAWFTRADSISILPTSNALDSLAGLYAQFGNLPEAERVLRERIERDGRDDAACSRLATWIYMQERMDEAQDYLESILAEKTAYVECVDVLADIYESRREFHRSIALIDEHAERAVGQQPAERELLRRLATAQLMAGRFDDGMQSLQRVLELERHRNASTYHQLAEVLQHTREFERALKAITRAIDLEPRTPEFHDAAANILEAMQRYDEASTHRGIARQLRSP